MGYWNSSADGSSLHSEDTGIVWGDSPAEAMEDAIDKIVAIFLQDLDREPTKKELEAGLAFTIRGQFS